MIRAWWEQRSPREQAFLAVLVPVLVVVLIWIGVVEPLGQSTRRMHGQVLDEEARLAKMQLRAREIEELARRPAARPTGGLRERVQAAFAGSAVEGAVAVIEPGPENEVRVRFDAVRFDALVVVLEAILRDTGARVAQASTVRLADAGMVRAELVLSR